MWGRGGCAQVLDDCRNKRHISDMPDQKNDSPKDMSDTAQRADIRTGQPSKGLTQKKGEIGGPKGPEPTRYGDWEVNGRCSDF